MCTVFTVAKMQRQQQIANACHIPSTMAAIMQQNQWSMHFSFSISSKNESVLSLKGCAPHCIIRYTNTYTLNGFCSLSLTPSPYHHKMNLDFIPSSSCYTYDHNPLFHMWETIDSTETGGSGGEDSRYQYQYLTRLHERARKKSKINSTKKQ